MIRTRDVDRIVAAYALLSGLALLFPGRPPHWPALAALHIATAWLGSGLSPAAGLGRWLRGRAPRAAALLHDLYPLLLVPPLYSELPLLNAAVHGGAYFDAPVQAWEQAIFGTQPSFALARAVPVPALSELLHACYLSYYLLIYGPPIALLLMGRRPELRAAVLALTVTFAAHYLFFVWFPVQGPRYLFPAPGGALADGPVYRLAHAILEAGSSRGAAFPSSHVGVAVAQVLVVRRFLRPWTPVVALLSAGLAIGAVYGGFHYAIDAVAGALLGGACAFAALRFATRPGTPPAGSARP